MANFCFSWTLFIENNKLQVINNSLSIQQSVLYYCILINFKYFPSHTSFNITYLALYRILSGFDFTPKDKLAYS